MASLTLDWLRLIALLGALQGVFLAGGLATRRRNRTANRILAVLMLAFSVYLATTVYHAAGWVHAYPHFFGLAYPLPFLFGPLVYLYAVSAADRYRPFTGSDALHLVPFLATVVWGLPIYMMDGADKVAFYQGLQAGEAPLLIMVADPLKMVSGVTYAAITVVFLRRHRERVKESYSSTERVNLRWLLWLGGASATIWGWAIAAGVLEATGVIRLGRGDEVVTLAIAALVYGIGYLGLRQPEVFRFETAEYPVHGIAVGTAAAGAPAEAPAESENGSGSESSDAATRYERSGLSEHDAERLERALLDLMNRERPWRDSELTLADLAERLDTTPHKLSEVLNARVGQTFYDFVNGYRVREVQRRIAAGEAKSLKILALAMDAGFASKSTFNQVFKKHTSLTPSDYRALEARG